MTTSLRFIGWCPVCERDIKVRSQLLVHHGYQRPGVGYIIGDCPGVGYEPYELGTGAADAYLNNDVLPTIAATQENLGILTSVEGPKWLYFDRYDIVSRRIIRDRQGHPETMRLTRTEADALAAQIYSDNYSWERKLKIAVEQNKSKLEFWTRERERIGRLISAWHPQPLRTIEQEVERQERSRAEREADRVSAKNAKVANEVLKIQKRIDAAVRNKNSATLADIYVSQKLRELSGYQLSADQARGLLERDDVWRAFKLLGSDGYLTDARETLDDMTWGKKIPTTHPGLRFERVAMSWPAALGGGKAKTR